MNVTIYFVVSPGGFSPCVSGLQLTRPIPAATQSKNVKNMVKKIDAYNNFLTNHENFKTVFIDTGDGLAITTRRN